MKKKFNLKTILLSAVTLCLAVFSFGFTPPEIKKVQDLNLTEAYQYGTEIQSLEQMRDSRVTLRSPIMEVTKRNLKRKAPEILSDTFYLPDFATGENTKAHITFNGYPTPKTPKNPLNNASNPIATFESYMLLRENMYYNQNALKLASEGKIKKHPAADNLYGEIPVENNAVEKRIVVDPSFKGYLNVGFTSGLYLPAGEYATVKVSGLKKGESITLSTHMQTSFGWAMDFTGTDNLVKQAFESDNPDLETLSSKINLHGHYNRDDAYKTFPFIQATFTLTENKEYKIACIYGGAVGISCQRTNSPVELIISGCVETPHYILGVTTPDYFEKYLRNAPGLICVLDVEVGQLMGLSSSMRNTDDIEKVAYIWHSIFTLNVTLMGRSYNYGVVLKFDHFVPSGGAVALSGNDAAHPADWLNVCLRYYDFIKTGSWGVLHELGHTQHMAHGHEWGMRGSQEGEVWNNVLIVTFYTMLCDMDARSGVEHGDTVHPYSAVNRMINSMNNSNFTDYNNLDYMDAVSYYSVLINSFTPQKFVELLYTYKTHSSICANSRADFIYRCAMVYGMDFRWYANVMAHAGITDAMYTAAQLEFLNGLEEFVPIACFYSNGINDTETQKKIQVSFYKPTTFDIKAKINCPRTFEILGYSNPSYGKIEVSDNLENVIYTPPKNLVESDEFFVYVKIEGNHNVKLPIRMSFNYNSAYFGKFSNVSSTTLEDAIIEAKSLTPTEESFEATAGRNTYNFAEGRDYDNFKFSFVATKSGEHAFSVASVGSGVINAGKDKNNLNYSISATTSGYNDSKSFKVNLNKGEMLYFDCHLLTLVKKGGLLIGVKQPEATTYQNISSANLYSFDISKSDLALTQTFVYKPRFIRSVKDFTKTTYFDKSNWKVLEAPIGQEGEANKIENIIDGNYSTIFHSKYSAGEKTPLPHIYLIDFGAVKETSFVEIATRNNGNSLIKQFELYGSVDGIEYTLIESGDEMPYSNLKAVFRFDTRPIRYLKLVVKSTSGASGGHPFSVISEISAGIIARNEQIIKASGTYTHQKWFKETSNAGAISAKRKGAKFYFDFKGTEFSLYANTGVNYGAAKVEIDGQNYGTFDLNTTPQINNLVYVVNGLEDKEHKVVITTLSKKEVNIGYMSLNYSGMLLMVKDIPADRALAIALTVFVLLFVAVTAFIVVYFTVEGFRNFINKLFRVGVKKDSKEKNATKKVEEKHETKKVEQKKAEKAKVEKKPVAKKTQAKQPNKKTSTKK